MIYLSVCVVRVVSRPLMVISDAGHLVGQHPAIGGRRLIALLVAEIVQIRHRLSQRESTLWLEKTFL